MFLISSRKDFWSNSKIADDDAIRECRLPDDINGKTVTEAELLQVIADNWTAESSQAASRTPISDPFQILSAGPGKLVYHYVSAGSTINMQTR